MKLIDFVPMGKRFLVRIDPDEHVEGGLIFGTVLHERPKVLTGTIVSVSKGVTDRDITAGSRIMLRSHVGSPVQFEDDKAEHVIVLQGIQGVECVGDENAIPIPKRAS